MQVIAWSRLRAFAEVHPDSLSPLKLWFQRMERGSFATPSDIKGTFGTTVDFVRDVVVFDIGGNKYRLTANIRYHAYTVYVCRVMTHSEYDKGHL